MMLKPTHLFIIKLYYTILKCLFLYYWWKRQIIYMLLSLAQCAKSWKKVKLCEMKHCLSDGICYCIIFSIFATLCFFLIHIIIKNKDKIYTDKSSFFCFFSSLKKCRQKKVFPTKLLNQIIVSKVRILRVKQIRPPPRWRNPNFALKILSNISNRNVLTSANPSWKEKYWKMSFWYQWLLWYFSHLFNQWHLYSPPLTRHVVIVLWTILNYFVYVDFEMKCKNSAASLNCTLLADFSLLRPWSCSLESHFLSKTF